MRTRKSSEERHSVGFFFLSIFSVSTLFDLLCYYLCKVVGCRNGPGYGKLGYILGFFIRECFASCFAEVKSGFCQQLSQEYSQNLQVSQPKVQSIQIQTTCAKYEDPPTVLSEDCSSSYSKSVSTVFKFTRRYFISSSSSYFQRLSLFMKVDSHR